MSSSWNIKMAEALEISPSYLSLLLNGKRPWRGNLKERYEELANTVDKLVSEDKLMARKVYTKRPTLKELTIDVLEHINKNLVSDMFITSKHDLSVTKRVLSEVTREFAYALCTTTKERTDFLETVGPASRPEEDHNHICTVCNTLGWCENDPVAKELKEERIDELEIKLKELTKLEIN